MAAQPPATCPDLRLIATDYDPAMVAVAKRPLVPSASGPPWPSRTGSAGLPSADDRFDLVLSFAMLHHVIVWEQAVCEALRVLRPGAGLVGYDLGATAPLHRGADSRRRMIGTGPLEAHLRSLPVTDVHARWSPGGFVISFVAAKAA